MSQPKGDNDYSNYDDGTYDEDNEDLIYNDELVLVCLLMKSYHTKKKKFTMMSRMKIMIRNLTHQLHIYFYNMFSVFSS